MESFAKRKINIRILANKGTAQEQDIKLEGLRCSCQTTINAYMIQGTCQLSIWGMTAEQMDGLTIFGPIKQERRANEIYVSAGDADAGNMVLVYSGYIQKAYADMNAAPNVRFSIVSSSQAYSQVKIAGAHSYPGARDAALILQEMAKEFGWGFENSDGVSKTLTDRTYSGSALKQAEQVAIDAQININIDRNILRIWSRTEPSKRKHIISQKTGMIGYPTFSGNGVMCTMRFNPEISNGHIAKVESSMKVACGEWNITKVSHTLESEIPGGAWQTQIETYGLPLK